MAAVAAVLIIAVGNVGTWAVTRIRNTRYGYERGFEAGWMRHAYEAASSDTPADKAAA